MARISWLKWAIWGWALCAACSSPADERSPERATATSQPQVASGPNVLLVTIDTLRADHLPMYGYDGVQTPNLSKLASEGVVFEHCNAHAPITLPSHTSILTGLYPPEHGARTNGTSHVDDELQTLAEVYQQRGYDTAAFVSAFVLDSRFGLDQGFDHYDDDLEDGRQRWSVFGVKDRRAENTVGRVLQWLDQRKADKQKPPFFLWLHLYDPHYEYDPPEPFRSLTGNPYDGEIAYTDHHLGRLLGELKARELLDDTLVAVTSDHGESLGQHGESTHSLFVYEATQHVPLILRLPAGKHAGRRVSQLVRHVDLAPTLVELSGLAGAQRSWLEARSGGSLVAAIEGRTLEARTSYAEAYLPKEQFGWAPLFALRDDSHKLIEAPRPELYNLESDPQEQRNLLPAEKGKALETALGALRKRPRWKEGRSARSLDAESAAKLRALGYVADEGPDPAQAGADPKDMLPIYEARERVHHIMNGGQYEQALPALRELLAKDPGNAGLQGDLAACLAELGRWDEAEQAYEKLAELRPTSAAAHGGLAKVAFKGRRDFERARKELEAAQALAPEDPSLHGLEGDLLHEQGKLKEAVEAYARAVEGGDQTPSYFVGYASALNLTGQLEEAREMVERAIRMDQRNAIAHHNHGVILERMDLLAAASGAYDEALALQPTLVPSVLALSKLLIRRGRANQALAVLQRGLSASPDDPQLLGELGALQLRAGQAQPALANLERAVQRAPRAPDLRTNLGFAYATAGEHEAAYRQYSELLALTPAGSAQHCSAKLRLGRVRAQQGREEDARHWLKQALACGGQQVALQVRSDALLAPLMRAAEALPATH